MARMRMLSRFVDYVRTDYPHGAPRTGHLPLFALLRRRLSDDEVVVVARMIDSGPPITQADIRAAITELLRETPLDDDADRVSRHLAATGWLVVDLTGRALISPASAPRPHNGGTMTMTDSDSGLTGPQLAERMARLAPEIHATHPVQDAFAEICAAAVDLIPGADVADIMLVRDGDVVSVGATSDLAATLDELQQQLGEGPCAQAATDTAVVRTDDFRADERWSRYGPAVLEMGVQSCLSFKLYSAGQTAATMNIFGFGAGMWDDEAETVGAVLAAQAAAIIISSSWGAALSSPWVNREQIGQAKGIILERFGLNDVGAFTMMRRLSEENGVDLAEVARRVIGTCTLGVA
ncbi:hypothetical protein BH10ACT9_BH10ACT9_04210 [soil metagenome]